MKKLKSVVYGTLAAAGTLVPAACASPSEVQGSMKSTEVNASVPYQHPEYIGSPIVAEVKPSLDADQKVAIAMCALFLISAAAGIAVVGGNSPSPHRRLE